MFLGALALIFTGYPVAFALGGTALLFGLVANLTGHFDLILFRAMPDRAFGTMSNYTLLAVPFFIFMGIVLEKSKLAEQLLESIGVVFGRLRGGLALGVIFVGALLAAGHRRGGGLRYGHGAHLAASHAPLRLSRGVGSGNGRGCWNPRSDHPAEHRLDRLGRPTRGFGRHPV